jgi:hypothetical protein
MNYVKTVLQKALKDVQETKRALRVFTNFECEQEYRKINLIEKQIQFQLRLCEKRKSSRLVFLKKDYNDMKDLRDTHGYTLEEIALIYNISNMTLSKYINNNN